MKGSLIIVSFFIIGTLFGVYHLIPYDFTDSKLSYYALCGLMFCVGISIGNDPNTLKSFRSLNPRLVFLPIMTILGTLAGCAIAGAFMSQRSPLDCMAVGAGFGYYSLSSIFITEYKGPEYRVMIGRVVSIVVAPPTAINPKIEKYSTIVFAHVLQKCFIKRYFYIKKQIIS